MKKILPALLMLVLVLTGIASADAPFRINLEIADSADSYQTSVVARSGDRIAIKLGETDTILEVQEKQEDGLNFKFDPALQFNDEKNGAVELQYFLLPANTEDKFTEVGKDSPVLTLSWEQLVLPEQYRDLINTVGAVLNGEQTESDDFSAIFKMMAGAGNTKNAGFYVTDLDNDGTPELLLGENIPMQDGTVFYDLYTITDNELVHVFDGWDRSRYYLVFNGGIAHEGSSSAFESFTSLNYYANGELHLMRSIIYNSNADPDTPWHLSNTSEYEISDSDEIIDESEARYILATYPYLHVDLEPFTAE